LSNNLFKHFNHHRHNNTIEVEYISDEDKHKSKSYKHNGGDKLNSRLSPTIQKYYNELAYKLKYASSKVKGRRKRTNQEKAQELKKLDIAQKAYDRFIETFPEYAV